MNKRSKDRGRRFNKLLKEVARIRELNLEDVGEVEQLVNVERNLKRQGRGVSLANSSPVQFTLCSGDMLKLQLFCQLTTYWETARALRP